MSRNLIVLIVDDDADDREILQDAFTNACPEATLVPLENGDALINWMHSCDPMALPSLIMLDLNMPGKDGRESLKELKADPQFQAIPIIVFTTSSSHRDKKTAYESGANCFITKPDTFDKLVGLSRSICTLWFTE